MEEKELTTTQTIKKDVEQILGDISTDGINQNNIDYIGKLVDIHKDLLMEEEMRMKEELEMRYGTYRRDYDYDDMSYGRRRRDSRGRYMKSGKMMDDMYDTYNKYDESRTYGDRGETAKSLEYMMQSAYDFICMLEDEASTDEEMDIIRKYARKISEL